MINLIYEVCNQLHTMEIKTKQFKIERKKKKTKLKSWNAAQSFHNLKEFFDEETIRKSQIEKWFKKFKLDDINLAKKKRPSNFDD